MNIKALVDFANEHIASFDGFDSRNEHITNLAKEIGCNNMFAMYLLKHRWDRSFIRKVAEMAIQGELDGSVAQIGQLNKKMRTPIEYKPPYEVSIIGGKRCFNVNLPIGWYPWGVLR